MSIREYFAGKEILVTGATGLVGKVLIEKIIHDLPDVRRVYVLIRSKPGRSGRTDSAEERLQREVLESSAFDRVRREYADSFSSMVRDKIVAVPGDLSEEDLGLDEATLKRLQSRVGVIINSAAVVSFDAPIGMALELNTLGPLRVLEFARGCKDPVVAHVSTCYVNGTREGVVNEDPLDPTKALADSDEAYDVDREVEAISDLIADVEARSHSRWRRLALGYAAIRAGGHGNSRHEEGSSAVEAQRQGWVSQRLVKAGMSWAQRRGWNDVYTFTKAMGEQMIMRHRKDVATLIFRPSIIESAFASPAPGWLDGFRMIDPLIVAYGRRQLPDFPGDPDARVDLVPVDMVVNALLAAIPTVHGRGDVVVYQLATSMNNPLTLGEFCDLVRDYFRHQPFGGRSGEAGVPAPISFPSKARFLRRLRFRYILPLRVLGALAWLASFTAWGRRHRNLHVARRSAVERLVYWAQIYSPYANVLCRYRSDHMLEVIDTLSEEERQLFDFDVRRIDWRHYIQEVHIPGIKTFLLGMVPKATQQDGPSASVPDQAGARANGDIQGPLVPVNESRRRQVLISDIPGEREIKRKIGAQWLGRPVRKLTWWLWSLGYRYYLGFEYEGVERVPTSRAFIVVANHTSHLDTGALLVILGDRSGCLHPVAAKDYWFRDRFRSWVSRTFIDAIPFDRNAHFTESLRLPVGLLRENHSLLYFPEGGRSVTGEMQTFKAGVGVLALESGAPIVPANITGSYQAMAKGKWFPRRHSVRVRFGSPIFVETYLESSGDGATQDLARKITEDAQSAVEALGLSMDQAGTGR